MLHVAALSIRDPSTFSEKHPAQLHITFLWIVRSSLLLNKPGAIPITNSADAVDQSMAGLGPRTTTSIKPPLAQVLDDGPQIEEISASLRLSILRGIGRKLRRSSCLFVLSISHAPEALQSQLHSIIHAEPAPVVRGRHLQMATWHSRSGTSLASRGLTSQATMMKPRNTMQQLRMGVQNNRLEAL